MSLEIILDLVYLILNGIQCLNSKVLINCFNNKV